MFLYVCLFLKLKILKFTGDGQLYSFIQSLISITRARLPAGLEGYGSGHENAKQ